MLFALASPDPMANIQVWPIGTTTETGQPIVTTSPADMFIKTTPKYEHMAYDVHILLVVNEDTYNKLDRIEITNGVNVVYYKLDFHDGITDSGEKIPQEAPDSEYPGYPGAFWDELYGVGSVKSKLGTSGPIFYCIRYVFDYVDRNPTLFTITVHLTEPEENLKVLVLALGTITDGGILDEHSAYTQSTLIIVPELATILLATASLSVFGLYTLKRKK